MHTTAPAPTTLRDLLTYLRDGTVWDGAPREPHGEGVDWTALPTFGGPAVRETAECWSWDATHVIAGACASELSIVPREEWDRITDRA